MNSFKQFISDYEYGPGVEYAVIKPTQIKSANHNSGNFNPNDPDITK